VVENAVAAIQSAHGRSGEWTVTQNAMVLERVSRRRRQVDVFLECPSGPAVFRVAIDVKDENRAVGIELMEQLCAKGAKLDVDRYVVVSTSGFAGPARREAEQQGVETATIEKSSDTRFFKMEHLTSARVRLQKIDVAFDDATERPPLDIAGRTWIEDDVACTQLARLAEQHVLEHMKGSSEWPEGRTFFICAQDLTGVWKSMYIDGVAWPSPREVHIWWTVEHEDIAGLLLCTDDGREAFTVITEIDGEDRQLTLVQIPVSPGGTSKGFRVAVDVRPLWPPRKDV
jgi:hypothetical protein